MNKKAPLHWSDQSILYNKKKNKKKIIQTLVEVTK